MKSTSSLIRLALITLVLGTIAATAHAGPGPQYWQNLHNESQYKELKAGDKIAYVCNECKTVSEIQIKSPEEAMAYCKEGGTVTCPSCKKETRIVMKRQRNDPPNHQEVTFVNDKGEECAFMVKAPSGTK